ncbi:MAG: DnaJ domain-containing protein [Candidatus Limnocylindrales bacterium]
MSPRAPRPPLPTDDLYVRLGIPLDASFEAIEVAWRGLLRKHHPDVAGPDGLDVAKRINVAHDWLSDPDLRARYDRERFDGRSPAARGGATGNQRFDDGDQGARHGMPPHRRRAPTTTERVTAIIERIGRLTPDELDRLALAEPAPIAFLATLRRFVTAQMQVALDGAERAAIGALPAPMRRQPGIRDAVVGRVAEPILADVLEELLGDPAGGRARERLTRGWDAAVGQPRYGPATETIQTLLERLRGLSPADLRQLAGTSDGDRLGEPPWPDATSRDEDEALRVSSELAAADAERAAGTAGAERAARRAAGRVAHLLVLRHAFSAGAFDRHAAPWLGTLIVRTAAPEPRVRHRP